MDDIQFKNRALCDKEEMQTMLKLKSKEEKTDR
jgi:hypothetical protein